MDGYSTGQAKGMELGDEVRLVFFPTVVNHILIDWVLSRLC